MTDNPKKSEKAIKAVENETDSVILLEIAKTAPLPKVRCAAIEKISDQSFLADIALNDQNNIVRGEAVKKLTDQSLIFKIMFNDPNLYVRETAEEMLTDQSLIADCRKTSKSSILFITIDLHILFWFGRIFS